MFAALGGVTIYAPPVIRAQTSRQAEPANQQAFSETANSQLREAASLLEQGRSGEAEPILRRVFLATPRNADAHNLLGIILEQRRQFKEAEREYRAALRHEKLVMNARLLGLSVAAC
ncbi:MAG: tetratricopeptide repeat protein [Acidobacteriota bacterium]|nr:tetratricopeptide repeat protein [Acidobacteriota bacterium]